MHRATSAPRRDLQAKLDAHGLSFNRFTTPGDEGRPYWDESAHYVFTMEEVLSLEAQTEELHRMCLHAVEHVITTGRCADFGIPQWMVPDIARSWRRRDPHVYGRFDLRYDGTGPAKMLEYNADTPTGLVESAVAQWFWLQDVFPRDDQWNSIHEALIARWKEVSRPGETKHLAWTGTEESGEDEMNLTYMAETAEQAGLKVVRILMEDIGLKDDRMFVDLNDMEITSLFKLYPWEWMVSEDFGRRAVDVQHVTPWIEPLWKMLLSNKALLAVLWELYPGHENLLPAYLDGPRDMSSYIAKPLLGREGASMKVVTPEQVLHTDGDYGGEGFVYQEFQALPTFDGWRPVLGSWVVGDEPVGVGIRETRGWITGNVSSFVPHRISD